MITEQLLIFTDGSVNTKVNIGYGAFLAVPESEIIAGNAETYLKIKRFDETTSVKLELQTLLWALNEVRNFKGKIIAYTDSQNILGLTGRRERLEKSDFYSKQNRRITNWELYRDFYRLTDEMNIEIKKVTGHKKTSNKNNIDRLFTLVDKASRKAMREENSTN